MSRKKNHVCVYILCFRIIYVCYKCQTLTIIETQVVDFFLLFYINIVKILKRKNISKHQQPHENIDKQLFQNYYYFVWMLEHGRGTSNNETRQNKKVRIIFRKTENSRKIVHVSSLSFYFRIFSLEYSDGSVWLLYMLWKIFCRHDEHWEQLSLDALVVVYCCSSQSMFVWDLTSL